MICQPCRDAADELTEDLREARTTDGRAASMETAREQHERCLGPTSCDCQHKVERHGVGVRQ